jgi:hypothetical protein
MIGGMVRDDPPDVVTGTVAKEDLRSPRIVKREATEGDTLLIDQREALRLDLLWSLRLSVR